MVEHAHYILENVETLVNEPDIRRLRYFNLDTYLF